MAKRKDPDAARLGRKGGKKRTEAKAKASRENLEKARKKRWLRHGEKPA
jgi:hypothetical protein